MYVQNTISTLEMVIYQTKNHANILIGITVILFASYFLTWVTGKRLLILGIIPRHFVGLFGILLAPLLHANFNHLFFNLIPLLVLSDFVMMKGLDYFYFVTLMITLLSGIAIWCFAKPGVHVGASALITGYWGLLIFNMYQQSSLMNYILGFVSLYYFAGIFAGIFPSSKKGVSWEGHLFGLLAGLLTAWYWPG